MRTASKKISTVSVFPGRKIFSITGLLFFLCLGGINSLIAQVSATIIDSVEQKPVPFANIVFLNKKNGTVSDIRGKFTLPPDIGDSIAISSVGYRNKQLAVKDIQPRSTIVLSPQNITLRAVDIYPKENPAFKIMEQVVEKKDRNNPDHHQNYSCIVYHKMTFDLQIPDKSEVVDTIAQKYNNLERNHHLMLMESIYEKRHLATDKSKERVISGRVSGFNDPSLAILPSQIQPFGFYDDYIPLLEIEYLNPASELGLKKYIFILEDTIVENNDSLYYISFRPRKNANIKPLTGSFHIHTKSYALKNIKASSQIPSSSFQLDINQSYEQTNQGQWFPSELESQLTIPPNSSINPAPFPLTGNAKSVITAINTNPELDPTDFDSVILEDDMQSNPAAVETLRYEPLSAKDSITYLLLDSIGRVNKFDNFIRFQKNLIQGYLPAGPFLINIKQVIGYNKFEGFKAGLGLWTAPELTGNFSIGGYFNHAFKSEHQNYGGGIKWGSKTHKTALSLSYGHDMNTTGEFSFYNKNTLDLNAYIKEYSVTTMDRKTEFLGSVESRVNGSLSGKAFLSHSKINPLLAYDFMSQTALLPEDYKITELGIKLRWAPGEKVSKTAFGVLPYAGLEPKVWINIIKGIQELNAESSHYTKVETQMEKEFRSGPSARTTIRLSGGWIEGWETPSNLYSFFGTYNPISIEVPNMFATMAPNEFAADQFALMFLRHKMALRQNKQGKFKPEIHLLSKAGWGNITRNDINNFKTFDKGFFESGILLDNLFNAFLFKYGIAVHYHYGPYRKEKNIDNWSFRFSFGLAL